MKNCSKVIEKPLKSKFPLDHRISIAPMLDWTDRHCRYFHRVLTKCTILYTEMVTTGAIIYGKGDHLQYNDNEHPLVLQLGGSDPDAMAQCAKLAQQRGYDEININVGCPSNRVQNGMFGACLMAQPHLVADCVKAMQDVVDIPVSVKSRIGIDDSDEYQFLADFVDIVSEAGCRHFIIHARKAWLKGLSPKQNREIPPLNYQRVFQLKQQCPNLTISINGGITSIEMATQHLQQVNGVMIGREAYQNPYLLARFDHDIYKVKSSIITRNQVIEQMCDYIETQMYEDVTVWHVARHMLGLFQGQPGAKAYRRFLSQHCSKAPKNPEILLQAAKLVDSKCI